MNEAGYSILALSREMHTLRSSSGARRASRVLLGASQNSSRKSTPPVASDTSPGRIFSPLPPPSMAALEAEMCGARNGRVRRRPGRPVVRPATEYTLDVRTLSSSVIGGRMPAMALAMELFPLPGAPRSRTLCPPALAISTPRLAPSWPMISAKSIKEPKGRVGSSSAWR